MSGNKTRSEDVVAEKWDRCLTNMAVYTATGLGVGTLLSVVLLKRKSAIISSLLAVR